MGYLLFLLNLDLVCLSVLSDKLCIVGGLVRHVSVRVPKTKYKYLASIDAML